MAALAKSVLAVHLLGLGLVIFGALWTRGRPVWTALHVLALLWGIVVEVGPWPCPLTLAEDYFERHAGIHTQSGSFLLHVFGSIVYPNLPYWIIAVCGVTVCCINLTIYLLRLRRWLQRRSRAFKY